MRPDHTRPKSRMIRLCFPESVPACKWVRRKHTTCRTLDSILNYGLWISLVLAPLREGSEQSGTTSLVSSNQSAGLLTELKAARRSTYSAKVGWPQSPVSAVQCCTGWLYDHKLSDQGKPVLLMTSVPQQGWSYSRKNDLAWCWEQSYASVIMKSYGKNQKLIRLIKSIYCETQLTVS